MDRWPNTISVPCLWQLILCSDEVWRVAAIVESSSSPDQSLIDRCVARPLLTRNSPHMRAIIIAGFLFLVPNVAQAHWHHHHAARRWARHALLVTVSTLAGPITVAADAASRFVALTNALVDRGFRGPVHCYAPSGHVRNSLHYSGHACDYAQTGWNRTRPIMYHSGALIHSFGLRDGCDFRHPRKDCGHVDTGFGYTRMARRGRQS